MEVIVLMLLAVIVAISILIVIRIDKFQAREQQQQFLIQSLAKKAEYAEQLRVENERLKTELNNERQNASEKMEILRGAESRLKIDFENLANRIFSEQGHSFTEQNKQKLSEILDPLAKQLEEFRHRVDEIHDKNNQNSTRLIEQVRQLQELSNQVSDDANTLARAIKGDAKIQGSWGEILIERILESCGLEQGRDYEKQVVIRTEDGSIKRPDFIINLPGNKAAIIDSKMSLTAYDRFCGSEQPEDQKSALQEHIKSVRKHIKSLQDSDYNQLLGNRSLDFVIMCIPLEPAYQAAIKNDENLIYDLAKSNVVISGPTTLMIILKVIAQIWRRENENKNSEEIAICGGQIYDQVVLVIEAMTEAQKKLIGATEAFEKVMKRLSSGNGNLIKRVERIRRLGSPVKKQLSREILERADIVEE